MEHEYIEKKMEIIQKILSTLETKQMIVDAVIKYIPAAMLTFFLAALTTYYTSGAIAFNLPDTYIWIVIGIESFFFFTFLYCYNRRLAYTEAIHKNEMTLKSLVNRKKDIENGEKSTVLEEVFEPIIAKIKSIEYALTKPYILRSTHYGKMTNAKYSPSESNLYFSDINPNILNDFRRYFPNSYSKVSKFKKRLEEWDGFYRNIIRLVNNIVRKYNLDKESHIACVERFFREKIAPRRYITPWKATILEKTEPYVETIYKEIKEDSNVKNNIRNLYKLGKELKKECRETWQSLEHINLREMRYEL